MRKWLLVGIVLLGAVLRLIGLGNHPAGFTPDEASFGYDAYSILKTGKDQWGTPTPLVFRSFGDFKLPLYTYLAIPSVAALGLTEFAVRLPNAILGTLAVLVVYLLATKLFNQKVGLMAGLLLAISPWHVSLSRGAFEANLTTFFLPLGILLFTKKKYLWAALIFGLNLFTYHTARILTPLIVFYLLWRNYPLREIKNKVAIFVVVFGVFLLGAVYFYLVGSSRLASSGIFDLPFSTDRYFAQIGGEPLALARIIYNKPVFVVSEFLRSYLSYFSPQFLYTQGAGEGTYGMVPGIGVVYLIEAATLAGFILKIIKEKSANLGFILFWILISPIPAALTKGPGYAANRVAFMMPAIEIASAVGFIYLFELLEKRINRRLLTVGSAVILLVSFLAFGEKYLVMQKVLQAPAMLYGRSQMMEYLLNEGKSYQKIIISRSLSEPQIYAAFYGKIDPKIYQVASQKWLRYEREDKSFVDQLGEYSLDKYTFSDINYQSHRGESGTLLVGKPVEFPEGVNSVKTINYPSGEAAIEIVKI